MLGFQGGVSIPLVKGGVKAPPAKRQCRAGPKAGARRGFTFRLDGGIERRLYELCRKHCGAQPTWSIGLELLYKKSGSREPLRNFQIPPDLVVKFQTVDIVE